MPTTEMVMIDAEEEVEGRWQSVLDALRTGRPYALAPWQPLTGEPRLSQIAFTSYRDSPQRDLALTAAVMGMKYNDIKDMAHLYEWQRRGECYDQWIDRNADAERSALIAKTQLDTAQAFSRLPQVAASAMQLVEMAVNNKLEEQAKRVRDGKLGSADPDDDEVRPLSISEGIRLAETVRGLLAETTRYLGVKIQVEHTHQGVVDHVLHRSDQDAIGFMEGLVESGFHLPAIEARATDAG